ncbi:hypothetical protein L3X38_037680 [Prunus dulcis]|uniref:Uncharacterized protein n=1 Tax=Prunus dulcis TaxID=3755 RepID=A0AAD4V469_PRUDU|nr:hypothetical protein L3X38_037680 [Prunus dulcis]
MSNNASCHRNNASCHRNNANNCHPTIFLFLPRPKPTLTNTAIIATTRDTPSTIAAISNTIVTFMTTEDMCKIKNGKWVPNPNGGHGNKTGRKQRPQRGFSSRLAAHAAETTPGPQGLSMP